MLRATLRGLLAHKLRLVLAALAVVLGVSFIAGTLVISDTIGTTFDRLFQNTTAGIDVAVRSASTGSAQGVDVHPPMPTSVLDTVRGVDGVREAFGDVERSAVVVGRNGKAVSTGGAPTIGLLWNPYADMTSFRLRSGRGPQGDGEVVLDAHTASTQGFRAGDTVRIVLPEGAPRSFRISGITGFGDQDNLAGATIAAFDPQAGRALLGAPDEYDSILVKADAGVSATTLQARVARALPHGFEAVTGQTLAQEQSDTLHSALSFLTTFLLVFAFIALFVGSFIILNTFSILVAQRTRELALLRCLGATRAQVLRSVLLESAVTGLVASAVGVALGMLLAVALRALLASIGLDLSGTALQFAPRTAVVGLAVGTVVTVLAAFLPARRATRVAPVEALRDAMPAVSAVSVARIATGSGTVVLGVLGIVLGLFVVSSNQLLLTGIGALLTFVGVAVLAPVIVVPVMSVLGAPVRRLRGVPGALARDNAMRQPRRTASTASALMIGVGLVSCFTVVAASLTDSINRIVDRTVTADYIVSPQSQGANGMSPQVAAALAADPVVGLASPISGGPFHYGNEALQVEAIDPTTILQVADVTVQRGAPLDRLGDGDVAISEDAAKNHSLRLGDTVPMQLARPGIRRQRVTTVYARNPLLGDYLMTRSAWQAGSIQIFDFVVLVKAAPGVSEQLLRQRIDHDIAAFPGTQVQNNAEYKQSQGQQIDVLLNLMTGLVVLAIVIALLGVVNTMALSIVERVRELGLVRALGMTRSQTRTMVRWETVLITVFGALLGCVVGLGFGTALVRAFASSGVDVLNLAISRQLTYVVVAFVAGLVAAIWPARRASRVDILQAITTE